MSILYVVGLNIESDREKGNEKSCIMGKSYNCVQIHSYMIAIMHDFILIQQLYSSKSNTGESAHELNHGGNGGGRPPQISGPGVTSMIAVPPGLTYCKGGHGGEHVPSWGTKTGMTNDVATKKFRPLARFILYQ